MTLKKKKILLVNDDGIDSIGIASLFNALKNDYDIVISAPESERSAFSHAISIGRPIKCERVNKHAGAKEAWAISGTPADCVKFAVLQAKSEKPFDMVISGINNGANLGSDIMYSGTVSAAAEASYLGIRAIAISLLKYNKSAEYYDKAAEFLAEILPSIFELDITSDTVLNINYPSYRDYKGYKITKAGLTYYFDRYVCTGENCFELQGTMKTDVISDEDCDVECIKKGYATITPLHLDRNDYKALEKINGKIGLKERKKQ